MAPVSPGTPPGFCFTALIALGDKGGEAQMALEIPRGAVFPSAGALGRERAFRFIDQNMQKMILNEVYDAAC